MIYPRKKNSDPKIASPLPLDFNRMVKATLLEQYSETLKQFEIIVEGFIFPEEIFIRCGFLENGRLRQFNFELSADFQPGQDNPTEVLHKGLDILQIYIETFHQAPSTFDELPLAWEETETKKFFFQTTRVHSKLEVEADDFLAQRGFLPDGSDDGSFPPEVLQALKEKLEATRH